MPTFLLMIIFSRLKIPGPEVNKESNMYGHKVADHPEKQV
jgi:hypothetical protein